MLKLPNKVSTPNAFIANYFSPALIVDCDIGTQKELYSDFRKLGFRGTESAKDGINARICIASRPRLGLIVINLATHGLDGVATIKDIARLHPHCSIILLSSLDESLQANAQVLAESYGLNVLAAHKKPLESKKLLELLSEEFHARSMKIRENYQTARTFQLSKARILSSLPNVELHFQPKICLRTQEIIGCEALARLILDFGEAPRILPPTYFIPHFEKEGKMNELTATIVTKSLDSLRHFDERGMNIDMSINLSIHDMASTSFPDFMESETKARSLSSEKITLEITEVSFLKNVKACLKTTRRLRQLGFNVSIDGIDSRFSELNHLHHLAFNEIKLNRTVIRDSLNDANAFAALERSIDIAKDQRLNIVAVGIESEKERKVFSNMGGDTGQGYLFSQPEPREKFVNWYFHGEHAPASGCAASIR